MNFSYFFPTFFTQASPRKYQKNVSPHTTLRFSSCAQTNVVNLFSKIYKLLITSLSLSHSQTHTPPTLTLISHTIASKAKEKVIKIIKLTLLSSPFLA
jgi:hypothetical protein